jgi:hypothetical protein
MEFDDDVKALRSGDALRSSKGKTFLKSNLLASLDKLDSTDRSIVCKITFTDIPMSQTPTLYRVDLDNGKERVSSGFDWKLCPVVDAGPEYELYACLSIVVQVGMGQGETDLES